MSGVPKSNERPLRSTGTLTRIGILSQVLLTLGLALAAVLLLTWLSRRQGIRYRLDLTAAGENTLESASLDVLNKLEDELVVDVFFRPVEEPYRQVVAEIQERMFALLLVAQDSLPEKIEIVHHDLSRPAEGASEIEARMRELGLRHVLNTVVLSYRERSAVLHLRGDIAVIDPGNPSRQNFVPPRILRFRGEEALIEGVLRVSRGAAPKLLFSRGHGERDLYADDAYDLGRLQTALVRDGFDPARWDGDADGPIPDDCRVVAVISPDGPFSRGELQYLRDFLDSGGRLIAAPSPIDQGGEGTLVELLEEYGLRTLSGIVARPVVGAGGKPGFGVPECAETVVRSDGMAMRHPVTEPLRRGERRVVLPFARALERGELPQGGIFVDLLRTNEYSWRDLPDPVHDWEYDAGSEDRGPFRIAIAGWFPPLQPVPAQRMGSNQARPESRLLVIGSAEPFTNARLDANRDFALNTFNWAASREFRVKIAPRDPERRRIEIGVGRTLFTVNLLASAVLPLACLLAGIGVAWLRRK